VLCSTFWFRLCRAKSPEASCEPALVAAPPRCGSVVKPTQKPENIAEIRQIPFSRSSSMVRTRSRDGANSFSGTPSASKEPDTWAMPVRKSPTLPQPRSAVSFYRMLDTRCAGTFAAVGDSCHRSISPTAASINSRISLNP